MTPEQQASLDALRPALPPIFDAVDSYQVLPLLPGPFVIDCEWQEEAPYALTTVGIGNCKAVVQISWDKLDDFERVEARAKVEELVRTTTIIYHNSVADIRKLVESKFDVPFEAHENLEDTMLADAVLHSEEAHDLGDLNRRLGKLPDYKHLRLVAPREYNAADIVATYLIWEHGLKLALAADPRAEMVYRGMSVPFIPIIIEGEEAGVRVDPAVALALREKYTEKVGQARALARAFTGDPIFNLASPDHMKHWLYNVYGLPEQREKAYGQTPAKATTDKDAIATLRRLHGTEWDEGEEPTLEVALANMEAGGHGLIEAKVLFGGASQRLGHYVLPCFEEEAS